MKGKHFLLLAAVISLLLVLAGCAEKDSLADRGYTVSVRYDYNGGIADSEGSRLLYYKENQPLLAPGSSVEFKEPVLDRFHTLEGWYVALTDESGNVIKDENGNILTEDTKFVWEGARATENCTIVAKWKERPCVEIIVDGYENQLYPTDAGKNVTSKMLDTLIPDIDGYTFLNYYTDSDCTESATFPLNMQDGDKITLYTKWLEGDVLIVRTRNDLNKIVQYVNKTVYLDADIDMEGNSIPPISAFGGKLIGNGHKVTNLAYTANLTGRTTSFGLLGELASGAEIRDVVFENVSVSVEAGYSSQTLFHIGLLAGGVKGNVTISGISFVNCSLNVTLPADAVNDMANGEDYYGVLCGVISDAVVEYSAEGTVDYSENKK